MHHLNHLVCVTFLCTYEHWNINLREDTKDKQQQQQQTPKTNKKPNLAQWVSEFIEVPCRSLGDSKVDAPANSQAQNGFM